MTVVDASAIMELLVDRGKGKAVESRIRGHRIYAPHLLNIEVLSVLRGLLQKKEITLAEAETARNDFSSLLIELRAHTPLLKRTWELRHNYSAYDAAYIATAEVLETRVLTTDARMSRGTGARCPIELVS
ncbi:MAG: type II toxin-antitoxin system VapC family toxin [Nocardiopsaceae bacterium]|nr:type II toxin-antitoxin system VapC family toxin [Nocardiopsaceae bacterium]